MKSLAELAAIRDKMKDEDIIDRVCFLIATPVRE